MVEEAQRQRTTFPDAREQFIADQGYQRTVIDPIVRKQQDLVKSYEGTGITPQTFPDWVNKNPNAFEMMNEWSMPGGGSWMGSPMWMDAGITNRNLGGAKVWNAGSFTADDLNPDWVNKFPGEVESTLSELNVDNWEPGTLPEELFEGYPGWYDLFSHLTGMDVDDLVGELGQGEGLFSISEEGEKAIKDKYEETKKELEKLELDAGLRYNI